MSASSAWQAAVTIRYAAVEIEFTFSQPLVGRVAILGRSGSGKSSVLRALCGLERPARGRIVCGEDVIFDSDRGLDRPPPERQIGYLPQATALLPDRSIEANLQLAALALPANARRSAIAAVVEAFGISPLLKKFPTSISGGQLQRSALAQVLVRSPRLLLLDEPLQSLDRLTADTTRWQLRQYLRQVDCPVIVVSHDRLDALMLCDRTILMEQGRVIQDGPTLNVFDHPASSSAAQLLGIDNILPGKVLPRESDREVAPVQVAADFTLASLSRCDSPEVFVCFKADDVLLSRQRIEGSVQNRFEAIVAEISPDLEGFQVRLDGPIALRSRVSRAAIEDLGLAPGQHVHVAIKAAAIKLLPR